MSKIIYLTTADVSPWTVPGDWNSTDNSVEVIGAGAGGDSGGGTGSGAGGGGAYSKKRNLSLTPGGTADFQVGVGGTATNDGTDTWFNGASLAVSSVGAKAGAADTGLAGGLGGAAAAGVGDTRFSGGHGGSVGIPGGKGGGGGAGGLNDDGQPGNPGNASGGGTGGGGDDGFGGAGGTSSGGAGGTGTEYNASHGSGGGGGGNTGATGGVGGNYGGGGGAGSTGGAGANGLIVITYTPVGEYAGAWNLNTNIPARFGRNNIYAGSGSTFSAVLQSAQTFKGWPGQFDYKFRKLFPVTEQQFSGFQPRGPVPTAATPQGWQGNFGYKFRKRVPAFENQFFTSLSLVQPPSSDIIYWGYSAQNLVQLPVPVDQLSFVVIPFKLQPTAATPQGWRGDFGYKFKKPLSPVLQQFLATRLEQPPSRDTIAFGLSANDVVLLPLEVVYQPFAALPYQQVPTAETPQGWQGDFGLAINKPLSVTQQPFLGFTPQGLIPTEVTPQGWPGDIGVAHVKPFSVAQQSFLGFTHSGLIPTAATPIGGFNVTPTYAFKRPTPVTEHQFSSLSLTRPPSAVSPHGWETRLDVKFAKRTPVFLNPWLGFFSRGSVPTAITKHGWWGYHPTVTIKPISAALQQFSFFQPAGYINPIPPDQVLPGPDPYIYPGDKKAKEEREKILGPYDPRKLSRKQRKLIAQLEAQRWEQLTAGPTREEKLHEDMQRAIAEVIEKAERKRIEDAKVGGLFAAPPPVAIEASLHAAIRVVKELEAQQALDDARRAIASRKQEAIERAEREAREAEERVETEVRTARKAKKAAQDAKLLAKYRMKKLMEASEIHDAVFDVRKPSRLGLNEILDSVIDVARRKK